MADYHNRPASQPIPVDKRFRLTPNKVLYRPRLRIRRPSSNVEGEDDELQPQQLAAGIRTVGAKNANPLLVEQSNQSPIQLPGRELTPFTGIQ
jgi:hypothetical protein